jgi:hypothetical protein
VAEIGIFSANDPNAALSNGLLLPAYDSSLKLSALTYHSDLGIAQYGFQDVEIVQQTMSRRRIRYGAIFTVSTVTAWWRSGKFDAIGRTFTRLGEAFELLDLFVRSRIQIVRVRKIWVDTFLDPYWKAVTVNHNITGAQVAQSFLVSNDFWLTKLSVFFTAKAAAENVFLSLVEVTNGVPDMTKAVLHQTLQHADMIVNGWTDVTTVPTFLKSGTRYALLITSIANHRVGMAFGDAGLEGTFFYSTDGAYFQGDLTKSMMLKLWGAKFRAAQVAIQLNALNLDGGIRDVDVLAPAIVPDSTQLIWEVKPQGSTTWIPLDQANLSAFDATPPLALFQARMVGTQDVAPGVMLIGSQVSIARPKLAFTHISTPIELAAPSDTIKVKLRLEDFDDTPHDCGMRLRVDAAWETPDVTEDVVIAAETGQLYRTFTFNLAAPADTFSIEIAGTTNNAGNTFHVAERVHWAL